MLFFLCQLEGFPQSNIASLLLFISRISATFGQTGLGRFFGVWTVMCSFFFFFLHRDNGFKTKEEVTAVQTNFGGFYCSGIAAI